MLTKAYFSHFTPETIPHRFEVDTPNIAGISAFNAVLDWMKTINWTEAENYAIALTDYTKNQLAKLSGFTNYRYSNTTLLTFNYDDIHHSDLATLLADQNIALRSGQHWHNNL